MRRELGTLREETRQQATELADAQAAARRWQRRATRAERQLHKARKRIRSQRERR